MYLCIFYILYCSMSPVSIYTKATIPFTAPYKIYISTSFSSVAVKEFVRLLC